jgi:hypothetical protein
MTCAAAGATDVPMGTPIAAWSYAVTSDAIEQAGF